MSDRFEWVEVSAGEYELLDVYRAEAAMVDGQEKYLVALGDADPDDADVPQVWTVYAVKSQGGGPLQGLGVYPTLAEAKASVAANPD